MPAPTESQQRLILPIKISWLTDVNPVYGTERTPRIQTTEIIERRYLPIFLTAAQELTAVNLGPFNYEVDEQQLHPERGTPLVGSVMAVNYVGIADRRILCGVINSAKQICWNMKNKGMLDEDIDSEIISATKTLSELEPGRIQAEQDSWEAGMLDSAPHTSKYQEDRFWSLHFKVVDYKYRRKRALSRYYS
jgi:hypothetical protein